MRGFVGRIMLGAAACAASASLFGWCLQPAYGQVPPKPPQPIAKPAPPPQAAEPEKPWPKGGPPAIDVCNGLTGADAAKKVEACTEAIKNGSLVGGPLALAYLNRGLADSGAGSPARSKADFREAIRISRALFTVPKNIIVVYRPSLLRNEGSDNSCIFF